MSSVVKVKTSKRQMSSVVKVKTSQKENLPMIENFSEITQCC